MPQPPDNSTTAFWAIIPAAGIGARMQADKPKQYLTLAGKTLLEHSCQRLLQLEGLRGLVVAVHPDDRRWRQLPLLADKRVEVVSGGSERADSVLNGLRALAERAAADDWVLVHDAARPCVPRADLLCLLRELAAHPVGGILGAPLHDTLKRVAEGGEIAATVPRSEIWRAFTPQMFRLEPLRSALEQGLEHGLSITDEASAMEAAGHRPRMVAGSPDNLKVTTPRDLALAEWLLQREARAPEI